MSTALALAGIAGVHLVAAISPGPAFVMVTRLAVAEGRRVALSAAIGVALGAMLWATAAVLGMHLLLERATWLYGVLQAAGGAYLLWLGFQAWRHAGEPVAAAGPDGAGMSAWRAWRLGVATNLANPKVVVFFGSIFVTLFTPEMPGWVRVAALAIIAIDETLWYVLVALLFSAGPTQSAYRRAKRLIDRATGGVLMAFGVRLLAALRA
jgi:RhtB (resistance to homoserine/threonine) family protein